MPGSRVDPYLAYDFKLDINGVTEGHFTECVGIGIDIDTIAYREAGPGQVVRQLPGQVTYQPVTLRYGLTNAGTLWQWLLTAVDGKVERKNVSIIQLAPDNTTEVLRWNLEEAWPSTWRAPQLNALARETAIESLTLVYENLSRA
jgi:phage tail-like protein